MIFDAAKFAATLGKGFARQLGKEGDSGRLKAMPEPLPPQSPQQVRSQTPQPAENPPFTQGGGYPPSGYGGYPGYPGAMGYAGQTSSHWYAGGGVHPGQPADRRPAWPWVVLLVGVLGLAIMAMGTFFISAVRTLALGADSSAEMGALNWGHNAIAVIDIDGVITDKDTEKVNKELEEYGNNSSIKAILLHIDSPGGGAAASQEIYHEVMRVREKKHKKVVASVESVGASGAYYIASGCDKIYANPASVVGSIGVIMEWTNYGDLMQWAKLKPVTIFHGALKDAGDPSRPMTPQEQVYFQSLVDNMYGQFVHDVAVGRHTDDAHITQLATGQVWTGEEAQPLGLIDSQGGFRTALIETARSVGIKGEPKVVRPSAERPGLLDMLEDADGLFRNPGQMLDRSPGFYFLWK